MLSLSNNSLRQMSTPFSAGIVFIRQILTYKDDSCDEIIKIFLMAVDP